MSIRRKAGERVYLVPNAGFFRDSDLFGEVRLMRGSDDWCMLSCGDSECREWDVWGDEVDEGLHHVSECQMLDHKFAREAQDGRAHDS